MSGQVKDELVVDRIAALTAQLGRRPTLAEVFHRDFTGTGKYRVLELGAAPKDLPRGGKRVA